MIKFKSLLLLAVCAMFLIGVSALSAQDVAQPYVVQKGDTLQSISKKFYGKGSLGAKLWKANRNLVAHSNKLTPGDTIYIFPESTLAANKATTVPPPPKTKKVIVNPNDPESPSKTVVDKPGELYDRGQLFNARFPEYINLVADERGLGGAGAIRVKIKRLDPQTGEKIEQYVEIREVGWIIASNDRGAALNNDATRYPGKLMLSTNDNIFVRITEDIAKILDSETYGDIDPYFREYIIYGSSAIIPESNKARPDYRKHLAELYRYKGKMVVASRVEGLAPLSPSESKSLKRKAGGRNLDAEPVTYFGRITYSEDAIYIGDRIFLVIPLEKGYERRLDAPYVEPAGTYSSQGY